MEPNARTAESPTADDQTSDCRASSTRRAAIHIAGRPKAIDTTIRAAKMQAVRLPVLLTADEAADLLRTTRRAIRNGRASSTARRDPHPPPSPPASR